MAADGIVSLFPSHMAQRELIIVFLLQGWAFDRSQRRGPIEERGRLR